MKEKSIKRLCKIRDLQRAVYQFELAQKANDGDFYIMSEIDAKLREQRQKVLDQKKD